MIDTFIAGNSELSQAVAEAKGSIPGLSDKVSDGAKSFGTARSSLDDTKTSLKSFSENVNQTMTSINDSMNKIQGSINATNLAGDAQQTADSLNQAALDAVELQRELNRLQEHLKKVVVEDSVSDADRTVIQKIIETIESINGGATDIEKAISSINQIAMGFSGDSQTDTINTQVSGSMVADAINTYKCTCSYCGRVCFTYCYDLLDLIWWDTCSDRTVCCQGGRRGYHWINSVIWIF